MEIINIPMQKIVARHRATRGSLTDWFADDSMKFFGTKLPETALGLGSRIAFVTQETGPAGDGKYSVRSFDWGTGKVETVGQFHSHATQREARAAAKQFLINA